MVCRKPYVLCVCPCVCVVWPCGKTVVCFVPFSTTTIYLGRALFFSSSGSSPPRNRTPTPRLLYRSFGRGDTDRPDIKYRHGQTDRQTDRQRNAQPKDMVQNDKYWLGQLVLLGVIRRSSLIARQSSSKGAGTKAPPFLGNLAKKAERNGRNGNPRKSDSDTGKR